MEQTKTAQPGAVKANQFIIDCMVETCRMVNRISDIDTELYGERSEIDSLLEAQQNFYNELEKELMKILNCEIYNERWV